VKDRYDLLNQVAHPLAGRTMTGADMLVQVLADEGVATIFGYSGGAILPIYDAVFRYNLEHDSAMPLIVPANEQGAGFMAAGYARASGRVGVALVTSGPGATNTVTPVRDSLADSVPIVVICGQVPTTAIGTDAFQEAPVPSIMGAVAKHVFLVTDPTRLEATIRTGFEIARTGRPGPVVVDIPKDVQTWQGTFRGHGRLPVQGYRSRLRQVEAQRLGERELGVFFAMLGESARPLVYAGGGVINGDAAEALKAFATEFNVPVVTTLMGIGAIDTTHERALRMLGMHGAAFANYAVDDCDFLIAFGARFDDRVAGVPLKFARHAKHIAHFDIDASEINKVKRVHFSHVGLLGDAIVQLLDHGDRASLLRAAHGFGIGYFGGFGWGWGHWGYDWHGRRAFFDHHAFVSYSQDFGHEGFHHGDFAHGNFGPGGFDHSGGFHGSSNLHGGSGTRGGSSFHAQPGARSSAFSGFDHGGNVRGFSSRGQSSFGGGSHGGGGHK